MHGNEGDVEENEDGGVNDGKHCEIVGNSRVTGGSVHLEAVLGPSTQEREQNVSGKQSAGRRNRE